MTIPELLAPAGSVETFRAGFEAGADAFYLGYGDFNARKRAKNFTEEELRLAAGLAHRSGRRMYITVNTLVFGRELPALLDLLELIRDIRADAVIVQDLGVLSLLRERFPEIPVHASTQMFCHNSLHAEFLKEAGISRIILPRELSLREIGTMMDRVPLEYEVFVHGAMCFSFSGCCLASSWLHGDSGNRGRCRQVCRHAFRVEGRECYPFSMRDLNALAHVAELTRLGVSSLKIEGRLKNADYVFETVSAYRAVLDAVRDGRAPDRPPEFSRQRETGPGYFPGSPEYRLLVQRHASGTAGETLGEVREFAGREIRIHLAGTPVKGMRLRVQDARGRNLHEGVLLQFSRRRESGGEILSWRIPEDVDASGFTPPFTVYVTGKSAPSDALAWLSGQVRKPETEPVTIETEISPGSLRVRAMAATPSLSFEREYPLATEPARTRALTPEDCIRVFSQTDRYPFEVHAISCRTPEDLFCPVGVLKEARRMFFRDLEDQVRISKESAREARCLGLTGEIERITRQRAADSAPCRFRYGDSPCPTDEGKADFTAYPISLSGTPTAPPGPNTVLIPPHFVSEERVEIWRSRLAELAARGYTRYIAPSYGWLALRSGLPGVEFIAGPYLYAVNPLAVEFLARRGVRKFILSPDIREDEAEPVNRFTGRCIGVNAPRELFITRLRIPDGEYRLRNTVYRPRFFDEYTVIEKC